MDDWSEISVDQLIVGARAAYLIDLDDVESIRCAGYGRHPIDGTRQAVAIESDDRLYLLPEDDCVVEFSGGKVRLLPRGGGHRTAAMGIKRKRPHTISTGGDTVSLFSAISAACAVSGPLSPRRSHPFFRPEPPDISLSPECHGTMPATAVAPVTFRLPPDLRYLYALAPLAFYLGASVEVGERPGVVLRGETLDLPAGRLPFERWAGRALSRSFQADCAVRYSASTGKRLAGIDVRALLGYAPEELMLMDVQDRFRIYLEGLRSPCRAFSPWHAAAYVDPDPSGIELMPFLMRTLSAVYTPVASPVTERDVISRSVREYRSRKGPFLRGEDDSGETVLLPSLFDAQSQHWFSGGCPVDAARASIGALKNGRRSMTGRPIPEVCIICNEPPMLKESLFIQRQLEGIAAVEVRSSLNRRDVLHSFGEGFDVLHFAGHSERAGLKCPDGFADLSQAEASNVPFFFLNCCSSYVHGSRLIDKGSVCGIATMFRVIDEAALDVCRGFYRMLAYGYPVMTSYLGARECSVTGKEYLLIGDGYHNVFNSGGAVLPFFRLRRNGLAFTLLCHLSGRDKGLIIGVGDHAVPDTGGEIAGIRAADLPAECGRLEGMCLYGGNLYDSVAAAVKAALADLGQNLARSRIRR